MDSRKILEKLDELFSKRDMYAIEPFLLGKLQEALEEEDTGCVLTILNELIGHYRETSQHEKGILFAERTKTIAKGAGLEGTLSYAVMLLNIANEYRACGRYEDAKKAYEDAKVIYDKCLPEDDFSYAAFYNNLGLLYQEMGEFEQSVEVLKRSLNIVKKYQNTRIEQASTHSNLAASLFYMEEKKKSISDILVHLEEAFFLFEQDDEKNYHYAAALTVMSDVMMEQGRLEDGLEYYEKARKLTKAVMGENYAYERLTEKINKLTDNQKTLENSNTDGSEIKGLELARIFYEEKVMPMIEDKFPKEANRIAAGLVGLGSESYGYDDTISRDHDWGKGVILWLTNDDYINIGEALDKEYNQLLQMEQGHLRKETKGERKRVGVFSISQFYSRILEMKKEKIEQALLQCEKGKPIFSYDEWCNIEKERLSKGTNGAIFKDELGLFTKFYQALKKEYPRKLWLANLAQGLSDMAHKGQYNYARVLKRKDYVTAELILADFCKDTIQVVYLLNHTYPPYYKWTYRGMENLTRLSDISRLIEELLSIKEYDCKIELVEIIAKRIVRELHLQGLSNNEDVYLEVQANEVFQKGCGNMNQEVISKEELVDTIVNMEWAAFDKVKNEGGRANCQDDFGTFSIMRKSQYLTWDEDMLQSYIMDFKNANEKNWNMVSEKYARMMESTAPEQYKKMQDTLPYVSKEKREMVDQIVAILVEQMEAFAAEYPHMAGNARTIHTAEDTPYNTSYETYLRGELLTYSDETLVLYGRFVVKQTKEGHNIAYMTMNETAKLYGYKDVKDAEQRMSKVQ